MMGLDSIRGSVIDSLVGAFSSIGKKGEVFSQRNDQQISFFREYGRISSPKIVIGSRDYFASQYTGTRSRTLVSGGARATRFEVVQ